MWSLEIGFFVALAMCKVGIELEVYRNLLVETKGERAHSREGKARWCALDWGEQGDSRGANMSSSEQFNA